MNVHIKTLKKMIKQLGQLPENEIYINSTNRKKPFVRFSLSVPIKFNKTEQKIIDDAKGYHLLNKIKIDKQTNMLIKQLGEAITKILLSETKKSHEIKI